MGLFDEIGEFVTDTVDAVSGAVSKYQRNRRKNKALRYEKQLASRMLKEQGKTLSGIATGQTAYSSAANTAVGIGQLLTPVASAAADITGAVTGSKAITAAAETLKGGGDAASSALGQLGEALFGTVAPSSSTTTADGAPSSTASNNIRTPFGDLNVSTAAILGLGALALYSMGGRE